ncbi:F-box domain-containing protein [Mycena chlorophos]|uniref:F-box domain-containing protein n=1 Tax=Mycena chlorophos TaxID=658473 RepID=A0A8H6S6N1_MYCCL|nr:F-box domain-containing protein [Mycena chlorophos]
MTLVSATISSINKPAESSPLSSSVKKCQSAVNERALWRWRRLRTESISGPRRRRTVAEPLARRLDSRSADALHLPRSRDTTLTAPTWNCDACQPPLPASMSEAHPTATYIASKSLELRGVLVPPSLPLPLRELCRPPSKFESKDSDRMNAGTMTAQQLFGPMLVGVLFNGILYGALVVQLFTYYDRYYKSDPFVRYLVVYLLIAETANTVFDINLIYQPLVTGWGNLEQLQKSPLFLRPDAAVTVAISTPVQLFMAWRLQRLTKHSLMPGIILLLALVSLAGGLSVTIKVSLQQDYSAFPGFKPFTTVWLAATAACDLFLSTALIYSLVNIPFHINAGSHTRQKVRKTGVGPTDRYIDRVIRLTIQTGSITAVAALLDLFVFLFAPSATLQFIWDFPLSKLYSNALLSS